MSKARLVITAVTIEKRPVSEAARAYGVARPWINTLLARYGAEGEAAFEPRSRRPGTSPAAISDSTVDLIIALRKELSGQGLDAPAHHLLAPGTPPWPGGCRLHHIGIGRTHAGTHIVMLVQDLHVRVINAATGELLRQLTLDPNRNYQPTGRPAGPTPGTRSRMRNPTFAGGA
jgi:Winged helix-turn helix